MKKKTTKTKPKKYGIMETPKIFVLFKLIER